MCYPHNSARLNLMTKTRAFLLTLLTGAAILVSGIVPSQSSPALAAAGQPSWADNATIYEVNVRQYTHEGTFKAFQTHLPRLKALGVKILWFMPVQPISVLNRKGTLGSPYSIADYKGINPEFGDSADFKALVDAAHAAGFKVVLDWVANHTGWDNKWITAHPDWYTKDEKGQITIPPGTDWTDVADLNYDNSDMRAAMIDSMKYWLTTYDIDGFRADVAGGVPTDFWETARKQLEAVKPIWMVAEDEDNTTLVDNAFNANYGWSFLGKMSEMSNGFASKLKALEAIRNSESYPTGTYPMTFITNHDENSWNGTEYSRLGNAVKQMSVFYFTAPGMPLIYTGQEIGFREKLYFFEKDEVKWKASPMTAFYQKLVALKTKNSALNTDASPARTSWLDNPSYFTAAYGRADGKNKVLVVLNLSGGKTTTTITTGAFAGTYFDVFTGKQVKISAKQRLTLPAQGYLALSTTK
jgi:glycosidase